MKIILLIFIKLAFGFDHTHSVWDTFLKEHLSEIKNGSVTQVDYAKAKQNQPSLKAYLDSMSKVSYNEFKVWNKNDRFAFLSNAYNAYTINLILTKYPDLKSIKDLGSFFSTPWKKKLVKLFGKNLSLDDIEHDYLRKYDYKDPRVHFAVNCASIGCPALRKEAFVGIKLDSQLEDSLKKFLADSDRNRFNPSRNKIECSKIFSWYKGDFGRGWHGYLSLKDFFAKYAELLSSDKLVIEKIKQKKIEIDYLDYDWNLNKVP